MPRSPLAYLTTDIIEAYDAIAVTLDGVDLGTYESTRTLRSVAEREFTVIGDAFNRPARLDSELSDRTSPTPKIVGFRNQLVYKVRRHHHATVWAIANDDARILRSESSALIEELSAPDYPAVEADSFGWWPICPTFVDLENRRAMIHSDPHGITGTWLAEALNLPQGERPCPWQKELLEGYLEREIPSALDLPTGLGKTRASVIWLVARAGRGKVSGRLVYVADRRTVVDQATTETERTRAWVEREAALKKALGLTLAAEQRAQTLAKPLGRDKGHEDVLAVAAALRRRGAPKRGALHFGCYQSHWGLWGLAWRESLSRAADQQASKDNDAVKWPTEREAA